MSADELKHENHMLQIKIDNSFLIIKKILEMLNELMKILQ